MLLLQKGKIVAPNKRARNTVAYNIYQIKLLTKFFTNVGI